MPYKIVKSGNGFFVGLRSGEKMSNGKKYLSRKPLSREGAKRQLMAVQLADEGKKIQPKRSKKKKKVTGHFRIDEKKTRRKCPKGYDECHCDLKKEMFDGKQTLEQKISNNKK